jgi:hypothetical protein
MRRRFNAGWKQELLRFQVGCSNPRVDRVPRLLSELKLDQPLCLLLHDNCAWRDMITLDHIVDAKSNQIAAAQLAVDRKVE